MTGRGCRSSSASKTPVRAYGPTRPIAPRRTRRSSSAACSRATSISGVSRAGRCPSTLPGPMRSAPPSARRSNTCSPVRAEGDARMASTTAWGCSSAPSVSAAPKSRSAWPTSPINSSVSPGSRGEVCPRSRKTGRQAALRPGKPRKQGRNGHTSPTKDRDQTLRAAVRPKIAGSSRCPISSGWGKSCKNRDLKG